MIFGTNGAGARMGDGCMGGGRRVPWFQAPAVIGTAVAARLSPHDAGDFQLRLVAAALSAALSEAARCWAEQDGIPPLAALFDQAVTTCEPLLHGLR